MQTKPTVKKMPATMMIFSVISSQHFHVKVV
jgi:hypothetical protein